MFVYVMYKDTRIIQMSSWSWCCKNLQRRPIDHHHCRLCRSSLRARCHPWFHRVPWLLSWGSWVKWIQSSHRRRAWKLSKWMMQDVKNFNIFTAILVTNSRGHQVQEFLEVDLTRTISIEVGDHLIDGLVLGLKTKRGHSGLQFLGIDGATSNS